MKAAAVSNAQLVSMIATTEDKLPLARHQKRTERAWRRLGVALEKALAGEPGNSMADELAAAIADYEDAIDFADLRLAEVLAQSVTTDGDDS